MNKYFLMVAALTPLLVTGCGGGGEESVSPSLSPINQSPPAGAANAANSTGMVFSPTGQSSFSSNPFFVVQVQNPNGIQSVNLRFSDDGSVYTLCNTPQSCGDTELDATVSNVNPGNYGAQPGLIEMDVLVTDSAQQTSEVFTWQFNWQPPQITGILASRDQSGTDIIVDWTENPDLLRYNLYLAATPGVNQGNYLSLPEGQALLAVTNSPQRFSNLTATQNYYLLLTGVDGSGESTNEPEILIPALSEIPNRPPVAADDSVSVNEDNPIDIDALQNDSDPDGDPLVILDASPTLGSTVIQNNRISFQPPANFNGNASIDYSISDGRGGTDSAQITVQILAINDPPVALDDSGSVSEDGVITFDVLQNDSDVDGDGLTVVSASASVGSATIQANQIDFQPPADFNGNTTIDYSISDGNGGNANAQVAVQVLPVNDPPVANDDAAQTTQNTDVNINVLANDTDIDGDVLTVNSVSPGQGTVVIESDNTLTYSPPSGFAGVDAFTYTINDPSGAASSATVTVTIGLISRAPVANDDNYVTLTNQAINVSAAQGVLVNDADPDGDPITVDTTPAVLPVFGSVSLSADGSFSYQPNSGFVGLDEFTYQIEDSNGQTQIAAARIDVKAIPDPLRGDSNSISGDLSYISLGETSVGSGIGSGLYRIGDCLQGADTVCTMRGTYTERPTSGNSPNQTGRYAFVQSYSGNGNSPVVAQSISPGSNSLVFSNVGDATFELYLFPDNGGLVQAVFPDEPFADSLGFGAFITSSVFCSGLPGNVPCTIGQVGLNAGSDLLASLDRIEFDRRGEALVKDDNASPQAANDSYSTTINTPLVVNAPGIMTNDSDPDVPIRGDSLQITTQFTPGIGQLAAVAIDEYRQTVYTMTYFGSSIVVTNRLGNQVTNFQALGEPSDNLDMDITPEAMELAGNPVPQGSLLFFNGETGATEVYAMDTDTGVLLAQLNTGVGNGDVIGGAYNPQTQTLFILQQTQSGSGDPILSEVDPLTGAVLTQIVSPFTALDFDVMYGDVDVNNETGAVYILGSNENSLLELNEDGSLVRLITLPNTISMPSGLAINQNGDGIWLSSNNGDLYELQFSNRGTLPELQAESIIDTENGTLVSGRDGSFIYTPNSGFVGDDIFTYQIVDRDGKKSLANVMISVTN